MLPGTAERRERGRVRVGIRILAALSLGLLSGVCGGGSPPLVELTLNGVSDDLNGLLIVPRSGFVINVSFTAATDPINPLSFALSDQRWGDPAPVALEFLSASATGAVGVLPAADALADGTHSLVATVRDTKGRVGYATFDYAVRDIGSSPPIGTNQLIWLDFEADRDGDLEPDFPGDLEVFGLASPVEPILADAMELVVRQATLDRFHEVYWDSDSNGLGGGDLVAIAAFDFDPGAPGLFDTTRICVGGQDPTGGSLIGNILIDPANSNRTSIECSNLVPTGIFPSELLTYASQTVFQDAFDPLMTSRGGTPVGEHALDLIVLTPWFVYESATAEEQARFDDIFAAVDAFADALGTICAHEVGHALGLVPPAAPGAGLYGGQSGPELAHAVTSTGGEPAENFLMKAGHTFTFAELAGLAGQPLPAFRPLSYAYLRDRAIVDASIQALLPPPVLSSVAPDVIGQSAVLITVTGADLAGTPEIQLVNESFSYNTISETWLDPTQATAWVIRSQVPPGLYDLVYANTDGQSATLPDAITVP